MVPGKTIQEMSGEEFWSGVYGRKQQERQNRKRHRKARPEGDVVHVPQSGWWIMRYHNGRIELGSFIGSHSVPAWPAGT